MDADRAHGPHLEEVTGRPQMRVDERLELAGVPVAEELEHPGVLGDEVLAVRLGADGERRETDDPPLELVDDLDEGAVARRDHDHAMELLVEPGKLLHVAPAVGDPVTLEDRGELVELIVGDPRGGEAGAEPLEELADREDLRELAI